MVRAAFSHDHGRKFSPPIDVEVDGEGVNGLVMDSSHSAFVLWTTNGNNGEIIKMARVFDDGRIEHRTTVLDPVQSHVYQWPGPSMVKIKGDVFVAWNDEESKKLGIVKMKVEE